MMATSKITAITPEHKLELNLGTTFSLRFRPGVTDPDKVFTPYDLSTHTLSWIVRDDRREHEWDMSWAIVIDEVEGIAYIRLQPADMQRFSRHRRYYYNMILTYPSGDKKLLLRGPIYVSAV